MLSPLRRTTPSGPPFLVLHRISRPTVDQNIEARSQERNRSTSTSACMDSIPFLDREPRLSAGDRSLSRVSTATSATLMVHTAHSADSGSVSSDPVLIPTPVAIPSGPLLVTSLSVTDWRQPYPHLGQFAMTPSEQVVAASVNGLVFSGECRITPGFPLEALVRAPASAPDESKTGRFDCDRAGAPRGT